LSLSGLLQKYILDHLSTINICADANTEDRISAAKGWILYGTLW